MKTFQFFERVVYNIAELHVIGMQHIIDIESDSLLCLTGVTGMTLPP